MAEERRKDDPLNPANKPHKPKGKKNTKRWCKGKVGVEHQPVINMTNYYYAKCNKPNYLITSREYSFEDEVRNPRFFSRIWSCCHQIQCQMCGKILEHYLAWYDCPDLPDDLKEKVSNYRKEHK
jgi:hypothetical protein